MTAFRSLGAAALAVALAGPAAALTATADTDLNLRTGPGEAYPVAGVIATSSVVDVQGCIAGSTWCRVTHDGQVGWASSSFLSSMRDMPVVTYETGAVVVTPQPAPAQNVVVAVPTGEPRVEKIDDKTSIYYSAPKVLLAPVATTAGSARIVPDAQVLSYVRANPVQPVYMTGDLVYGAGLPEGVTLYPVPNATLSYVNVNDQLVLVEPESRTVVEVVR